MPETKPLLDPELIARLERLEIVSKKIFVGKTKGERRSKRKGQSVEFADFRPYSIGDDLRFLDWNLFARLDRLFLRLFYEEEDLHVHILLDHSLSMNYGNPSKLHYTKQVAAALGFIGLINMDRVALSCFNETLSQSSGALRGRRSFFKLLQFLESVQPSGESNLTEALKTFSMKTKSQGVTLVISDFMDKGGYEEGLRYLLARNMDIYVIQVLSKEEIEPNLVGDLRLTDMEDGDETEITISAPLLKRYKETLKQFRGKLSEFCSRRGISYLFTNNQVPFEKLVLSYLMRRGLLR